jgi:hypothetical protein
MEMTMHQHLLTPAEAAEYLALGQSQSQTEEPATVMGEGFLSLAAAVFASSEGVAAVRILEAATGATFNAVTALSIARAIDEGREP